MRRNQKGFTLMELMVVIVIVAILAAVAVPLYINYVKDAQRTEAKGAIGAIITAEQVHFQQLQQYADLTTLKDKGLVDLEDVEHKWAFDITVETGPPAGFEVVANQILGAGDTLRVVYTYDRGGTSTWTP